MPPTLVLTIGTPLAMRLEQRNRHVVGRRRIEHEVRLPVEICDPFVVDAAGEMDARGDAELGGQLLEVRAIRTRTGDRQRGVGTACVRSVRTRAARCAMS